jgi:hypothetical protein
MIMTKLCSPQNPTRVALRHCVATAAVAELKKDLFVANQSQFVAKKVAKIRSSLN